jgi:cathepsin L
MCSWYVSSSFIAFLFHLSYVLAKFTEFEYQSAFTFWMQEHQKSYAHEDFQYRFGIFRDNMDYIAAHNQANKGFTLAMNQFGDLTLAEFSNIFLGTKYTAPAPVNSSFTKVKLAAAPPASFDWRTRGAVTGIKNQAQCGSCWSFSTTGSTEGCHYLTTKKLVGLSEQNLMDCSTSQGNQGCDGGLMTQAMQYIIDNKGVDTEASYPYTAQDGTCAFKAADVGATLTGFTNVNTGDENDLLTKAFQGPTSVAIDASQSSFQFYSTGVYYDSGCSSTQLDHGVLVVGWGTDAKSGSDYWIVKNSWGTSWGLTGYIWMSRNKNNNCGIATMATLPQC